jgi:Uma2 family endonuclease
MATQPETGLTYEDLLAFPEDNLRRELINGELIVTAAPGTRHQRVVKELVVALAAYERAHGGEVLPAPYDVFFSDVNVVEPDVIFVTAENLRRLEERFLRGAPDLVIEVSSPSTRRLELRRKLELYQRFAVPEYWYVDLEADRVEVYRLAEGSYRTPILLRRGDTLDSPLLPDFSIELGSLLGPEETEG